MSNKLFIFGIASLIVFGSVVVVSAAPYVTFQRNISPETDSSYYLGTTTPTTNAWASVITNQVCLTSDTCRTTWPAGGSGVWPFSIDTNYGVTVQSTTTPEWFRNGLMSSTTAYFVFASTSQLSANSLCLNSDN